MNTSKPSSTVQAGAFWAAALFVFWELIGYFTDKAVPQSLINATTAFIPIAFAYFKKENEKNWSDK